MFMKYIEIEIKYKISKKTYDEIIKYFKDLNITSKDEKQHDIYYSPIHFPFLGGEIDNECLRIRIIDKKNFKLQKIYSFKAK